MGAGAVQAGACEGEEMRNEDGKRIVTMLNALVNLQILQVGMVAGSLKSSEATTLALNEMDKIIAATFEEKK